MCLSFHSGPHLNNIHHWGGAAGRWLHGPKRHCHERPCRQSPISATKPIICHNDLALHKVYVKWGGSVSSKTAPGALSVTLGNKTLQGLPFARQTAAPPHTHTSQSKGLQ